MKCLATVIIMACLVTSVAAKGRENTNSPDRPIDGEQVYKSNCTRCHNTPPALSQRQAKAVVNHMRVRANLLAVQADAVLRYLAEDTRSK
jgi:hypothetical protein